MRHLFAKFYQTRPIIFKWKVHNFEEKNEGSTVLVLILLLLLGRMLTGLWSRLFKEKSCLPPDQITMMKIWGPDDQFCHYLEQKYEFLNIASFHPLHHHQLSSPSCCPSARGCACSAQCAAPINFDSKLVKCSNGYLHLNMLFLWQSVHIEHVCIMYAHKCAVHTHLTYQ